ncbi:MAG: 4Fe-4S binding protein [Candidatus Micrarchaeota archaeon]
MIVGVTGGKGGTGKTVLALNLALAFAKSGRKVKYLDCDADSPASHMLVGAERKERREVRSFVPKFNEKCTKCGKCVKVCEVNALYQLKGKKPVLLAPICNGCKACTLVCPARAIEKEEKIVGWTYCWKKYGVEFFSGELKPSEPLSEKIVDAVKKRGL